MSTDPVRATIEPTDASAQPAPCVRFDGVSIGGPGDGWALSFALAPGSFHWLTGATPGLRTGLLRLISLARPPARGLVQLFGRDVSTVRGDERLSLRRRIGSAFAPPRFFEHLSVWDNAALVPRIAGRAQGDYGAQVDEVLAWVGLGKLTDQTPSALNAEQKARLALARAIANRPEILVVGDPAEDLAYSSHEAAWAGLAGLLAEIHHAGIAVIAASPDPGAAARSGDPVLHLLDGRVSAL
jgi:cell division transport system ATP-binding protein